MKGLNLSGFKKVAQTKESTTMAHPSGHKLEIMHKSVNPKMRAQLKALPMAEGGMAEPQGPIDESEGKNQAKRLNDPTVDKTVSERKANIPAKADNEADPMNDPALNHRKKYAQGTLGAKIGYPDADELQDPDKPKYKTYASDPGVKTSKSKEEADKANMDNYYSGGPVKDDVPEPDKKKAKQMQDSAMQSGWQPAQWVKNFKEGISHAEGGKIQKVKSPDDDIPINDLDNPDPRNDIPNNRTKSNQSGEEIPTTELSKGGKVKRYAEGGDAETTPESQAPGQAGSPQAPVTINIGTPGIQANQQSPGMPVQSAPAQPQGAPGPAQPLNSPEAMLKAYSGGDEQAPVAPEPEQPPAIAQPGPSVQPQAAPSMVVPPAPQNNPFQQYANNANNAISEQQKGLAQQQVGEVQQATGQSEDLERALNTQIQMKRDYENSYAKLDQARAHFSEALEKQNIDPNRYINKMSTGDKIFTALGLIAGGLGAGLNHTSNVAMDFLNQQIDRDIQAQKANMGKNQTLLEANLRQFGNMRDATEMTRLMYSDAVGNALKMRAADAVDPISKGRLLQASGQLDTEKAKIQQQVAMNQMLMQASQSGNTDRYLNTLRVINPDAAKEIEGRYVPGVGIGTVPVPEKVRGELVSRQNLQDAARDLRIWAEHHSGAMTPEDINTGSAKAKNVQDLYRSAAGQGVFREAEAKFVNGIVSDNPTAFLNKYRVIPGYKALEQSNQQQLNGLKRSYGLPGASNIQFTPKGK